MTEAFAFNFKPQDAVNSVVIGGQTAFTAYWPQNPEGQNLLHVLSIDCQQLKTQTALKNIPEEGFISVFSTYALESYFLDNITYFGDALEYKLIASGYTFVSFQRNRQPCCTSNSAFIPKTPIQLRSKIIEPHSFPTFSFFADEIPRGLTGVQALDTEYDFLCQLYSSDFPSPYQDIFYLSDAIGYLFIRKNILTTENSNALDGLFFVQTA